MPSSTLPNTDPTDKSEQSQKPPSENLPNSELSTSFQPVQVPDFPPIRQYQPQPQTDPELKELVEEVANDMLRLLEWMKRLEARQDELYNRIESVLQSVQENKKLTSAEISQLRQEVLGDKKFIIVRSTFNAILPTLDSFRAMEQVLSEKAEDTARNQVSAAISSLTNIIQSLGFSEFQAELGTPFDPFQMECLGYGDGPENQVLQIIRSGYKAGSTIIRPCGVILAQVKQSP